MTTEACERMISTMPVAERPLEAAPGNLPAKALVRRTDPTILGAPGVSLATPALVCS